MKVLNNPSCYGRADFRTTAKPRGICFEKTLIAYLSPCGISLFVGTPLANSQQAARSARITKTGHSVTFSAQVLDLPSPFVSMSPLHPRKRQRLNTAEPQKTANNTAGKIGPIMDPASPKIFQWDLEQDYENSVRLSKRRTTDSGRLPIKTAEGRLEKQQTIDAKENESEGFQALEMEAPKASKPVLQKKDRILLSEREQILEAKETLARVATLLSENPEEYAHSFRSLAHIAASDNATIKKLALASQMAVFKDIIPGYRIRPLSQDPAEKLSKETMRLRSYEQTLVDSYHSYVKELARCAKSKPERVPEGFTTIPTVATACACSLLLAVPHFNFRGDLLQIVVDKLGGSSNTKEFTKCHETLERLFRDDDDGKPSLDAVVALSKMMKVRNYHVDESILNTFLQLRLLSEFSFKGSQIAIDTIDEANPADAKRKLKFKKEFRTKKQRKLLKERKAVETDYEEADAVVGQEERDKLQSETLKIVFITYFRILKTRSANLIGAVLEGLAKYAHLINQDFFGDLLEVLKDISAQVEGNNADPDRTPAPSSEAQAQLTRHAGRTSLLCAITAFALLEGQHVHKSASDLQLDLSFFVSYLYRDLSALATNPNIERRSSSSSAIDIHNLDARTGSRVNIQTTSALLLRILGAILVPSSTSQSPSSVSKLRVATFTKQVMMCSLQVPEKSAMAMINLVTNVSKVHGRKINGLWYTEESKGDGFFDTSGERGIEGSNVFTSTVWEGEILKSHFCPNIREKTELLNKTVGGRTLIARV